MRSLRLALARSPRRTALVVISAALAIGACADSPSAASLTGLRDVASVHAPPTELETRINTLIRQLYDRRDENEVLERWRDVKKQLARHPERRRKYLELVEWLERNKHDVRPPAGETRAHAVARLVLLMSVYVYGGPTAVPPVVTPATDAILAVVESSRRSVTVRAPSGQAAVVFPPRAVSQPTVIVLTKNEQQFEPCAGPLPTTHCQHPQFYRVNAFPDVKLNAPATVAVCQAQPGESRFRLAHQKPADPAANHPDGQIDGDIEILPVVDVATLVGCQHARGGSVFMFSDFGDIDPHLPVGEATRLDVTIPEGWVAGQTQSSPIVVELRDDNGFLVTTATGTVSLAACHNDGPGGPCAPDAPETFNPLLGTLVRPVIDGRATFDDLMNQTAGSMRLGITTDGGLRSLATFIVTAGPLARLQILEGNAQTGLMGTILPIAPRVRLTDLYGNTVVSEATVRFTVGQPGGGSVANATVTSQNGEATSGAWTLGPFPGGNILFASADGATDAVFFATATAPTFNATNVAAGWDFTCAIAASPGPVVPAGSGLPYCWSDNARSQLGEGTQTPRNRPTLLAGGLLRMTQMTGGQQFACGLAAVGGGAYCWGYNLWGQLGIDVQDLDQHATPVAVLGGNSYTQISAGFAHVCALDASGVAWCWGASSEGNLGRGLDNTGNMRPDRVAAMLPVVNIPVFFTQIDVGGNTSCGVSVSDEIWCWGNNSFGQLGNNSTDGRAWVPVKVAGDVRYREVSVGNFHVCAISTTGSLYCWGRNAEGQLGTGPGSPSFSLEPVPVLGSLGQAKHVSAGNTHTCAVNTVGEAYCWGDNSSGQLGDLTLTPRPTSVRVLTDALFTSITTGLQHTCAIRQNGGGMFCWGSNGSGRLGIGNSTPGNRTAPVQVALP